MSRTSKTILRLACGVSVALASHPALALQPLAEFQRAARSANFDAREAELVTSQRGHEASAALGRLLPSATVSGAFTRNQYEVSVSRPDGKGGTSVAVITPEKQLDATFGVRVPVLDVGGWLRLSAARASVEAAGLRAEAALNDADAEVARQYYGLVGATWLRDAAGQSLLAAEKNLDVLVKRREAERALETDVLRARAEVERAKMAIAEAENQVRAASRALRTASGLEPTSGVPKFTPPVASELPKTDARVLAAGAPAVKAAEAEVAAADKSRSASWAAFAPTVSAQVNERVTNATGFAGRNALFNVQVAATWTLDYSTLANARASESAAALARVRAERARQAQADLVSDASDRVEVQAVRARSAAAEEDAAQHAAALWRERLAAGNATALEVVQAERDAFAATASRIQTEADLAFARELYAAKTKGATR